MFIRSLSLFPFPSLSSLSSRFLKGKSIPCILVLSQVFLPKKHSALLGSVEGVLLHSQFLWVRNWEVVDLASRAHGLSLGISQGVGQDCSLIRRQNHWRICFQAPSCGCWQYSAHHRLWDWGSHFLTGCWPQAPSIICTMGFSTEESHHGSWLPSEQANGRAREGEQDRQQSHAVTTL